MPSADLIDNSPHQPIPQSPLASASNLILIDNYDSFTWNVYQYLVLEGATVTVYRNDEVTLDQLIKKDPTQLVVSPGPGHPDSDGGISKESIKYFAGKIPVLGVCMGEQCMFSVFGGTVDVTGEILHGKTSLLQHDGKGVYAGLSQDLPVTRYHSLAGTHATLPPSLEVTSWTQLGSGDGTQTVIMGVRHKEFTVEGVQFHPESILSAEGRPMIRNFLQMQGGTWAENAKGNVSSGIPQTSKNGANVAINGANAGKKTSILDKIYAHRRASVAAQKLVPSQRPEDLQAAYEMDLSPPLIDFAARLATSPYKLSLMAEIKRASPSKGVINITACAPQQARTYALAGASVISVLTEPEWFKGSIDDLRAVRRSLEGMPNRPAVLRKEFVFDEYQILEARLAGADTVLLIVKMLETPLLLRLYEYSKSLGMEPLVEVNTLDEMKIAVDMGSKVIGVNNRNLTNFEVDLDTTSRLMSIVPENTIVCALSGISGAKDVEPYLQNGVGAVLVGEALMRASDTVKFISQLLGGGTSQSATATKPLVKICGTRTAEAAQAAIEAGADLIGMILVTGRKRCVPQDVAFQISRVVHSISKPTAQPEQPSTEAASSASNAFKHGARQLQHPQRALLVGVFQNQPLEYILSQQKLLALDVVQLHGSEPIEWARLIPVPVIRAFKPTEPQLKTTGYHTLPLLDSGAGGTGERLDLSILIKSLSSDDNLYVLLAGGLNPDNVRQVLTELGGLRSRVLGIDVSSGVEEGGEQSIQKIKAFISAVKQ